MRRRPLIILLVGALFGCLWIAAHALIPPYISQRVQNALQTRIPQHEAIRVQMATFPVYRMFQGWLGTVAIEITRPELQDLELESFSVIGRNVKLDLDSLRTGNLVVREAEVLTIEAIVDEASLTSYLRSRLPEVRNVRVDLQRDRAWLYGTATVLGRTIDVAVSGTVELIGSTGIQFVPDHVMLEEQTVPKVLVEAIALLWRWDLELSAVPFPIRFDEIELGQGKLTARGAWVQVDENG